MSKIAVRHRTLTSRAARIVLATVLLMSALATSSLSPSTARANQVNVYGFQCQGPGGTWVDPYWDAYTFGGECYAKYLGCTYWINGNGHFCAGGWSAYDWYILIDTGAGSISGSHRLCNADYTICSLWGYTSDS